ncbi:MAG: type II secretion system F family protein [Acidimicrobiales bacterium]
MSTSLVICLALTLAGGGVMALTVRRSRRAEPDTDEYFAGLELGTYEARLAEPLPSRLLGATGRAITRRLERMLPRSYLENLDRQLAQAGMAGKRKASQQFAIQLGLTLIASVVTVFLLSQNPPPMVALSLLALPVMGFAVPNARMKKAIRKRSDAMFKDLPDIVDMLAIAVEAGSGFESALALVCKHFDSPLTDELAIALREMEFGMSRKETLQQLRERTDLDAVRNLVLALLQADALGIPIGRVLKGQAQEVRARRRAWAREKAAKLPVKILFPLVLFIFPPILALVLGPAMAGFTSL